MADGVHGGVPAAAAGGPAPTAYARSTAAKPAHNATTVEPEPLGVATSAAEPGSKRRFWPRRAVTAVGEPPAVAGEPAKPTAYTRLRGAEPAHTTAAHHRYEDDTAGSVSAAVARSVIIRKLILLPKFKAAMFYQPEDHVERKHIKARQTFMISVSGYQECRLGI
jgi:hypothetical protein